MLPIILAHPPIPQKTQGLLAHPRCLTDPSNTPTTQENLKIFQQYTKLLAQAGRAPHPDLTSPSPLAYPAHLEWFEHLSRPVQPLDEAGASRISQLLQIHLLVADPSSASERPSETEAAFELAKSLPHYDRDLTLFYLQPLLSQDMQEYELQVAHSILRLHNPPTLAVLKHDYLPKWREQGLLHVLSVAAYNMPDPADWGILDSIHKTGNDAPILASRRTAENRNGSIRVFPPHPPIGQDPDTIHLLLTQLFTDGTDSIKAFIDSQNTDLPQHQAFLTLLDRLAILMNVKSNATFLKDHDLGIALGALSPLDSLPLTVAWSMLKAALEIAMPPSMLLIDPSLAKKRLKHGNDKGSWYACHSPQCFACCRTFSCEPFLCTGPAPDLSPSVVCD